MSDDPSTAFRHPAARAETLAEGTPRDRIAMTEHLREVEIGAFRAERGVTRTIRMTGRATAWPRRPNLGAP
ncbi:MAG: hypothetical protein ACOCY0_05795 [Roseicyclus sp.]